MSIFERYLTLWVGLCIVAGIGLGHVFPNVFQGIGELEVAHINIPVAALVWLMIIPMLLKIDLKALKGVKQHWRGVGVTLFVNWGVKPFSMTLLGWLFIGYMFRDYLPAEQIDSYIAGLIILAAAPCTAMVFVWSDLMRGEPHFTLAQVALNDVIMIFAFAPIVALLLGLSAITVPWDTLFLSVLLYIVVPLVAPVLMAMGVDPVWLGVMIALNLQTSFLTPPFGFALFYLRGVAPGTVATADIYRGAVPFVILQLVMLGVLALWPDLVTWLPKIVYAD